MPLSLEFLRGVLGALGVIFAHLAGLSGAKVRKGKQKLSGFYAWLIRAAACIIAVSIRHELGVLDVTVWVFGAGAFVLGWWDASRARPEEDLTHQIFPE
jgi:hypothetical protein